MYLVRTSLGPVDLAFTARHDGPEAAAQPLDLSGRDGREQLERVVADFAPGSELAAMTQVHGREVAVVRTAPLAEEVPTCDALVTDASELTLVVRVADCVPVLLADPAAGVIGAAHAGRNGVAQGVVPAAVEQMRACGAAEVVAWIGPHVCGSCYEVPEAMQVEVAAQVPATATTTRWDTPGLDLGAGVRAQLATAGVRVLSEPYAEFCTMEEPRAWSHRRDGVAAGRMAGLIRRRG